jgi:LasA protease
MGGCVTTRSGVRRLQIFTAWAFVLMASLACSQGYVSPVELTATAAEKVLETPDVIVAASTNAAVVIEVGQEPVKPLVPTYTDMPDVTSTPKPTRTPDPNATPKPPIQYYTQAGDTLPSIIGRYGVNADQIISTEPIPSSGLINPGTLLIIPDVLDEVFDSTLVLPDSEVVYSPSAAGFDILAFVEQAGGYLGTYQETVGSKRYTGAELVQRVALENSINPYLLLALLEYQSHWLYSSPSNFAEAEYPMGMVRLEYKGLYKQLSWAVQQLNIGYYGWRAGTLASLQFRDGSTVRISPGLNAGSAAVQYLFSRLYNQLEWAGALYGAESMPELMKTMFGDPWIRSLAVEPLYPTDLLQPAFQLPFMDGRVWSLTGGPHSAWGEDGALAALDFAPPSSESGCAVSNEWVTAVASGVIVRTGEGIVILDMDGDGIEQTGWNLMYLHIEMRDRVKVGTVVEVGDKIGHPSCEGGISTGTHVHISRKFNGEWILADGPLPFNLSGYLAVKGDKPYQGTLVNGSSTVIADSLAAPRSNIQLP